MPRKGLAFKPGAGRQSNKPDIILCYKVEQNDLVSESIGLLEFLLVRMNDRKRTTVKDFLKHNQVMVNGYVTTTYDQQLLPGDEVKVNTSREFQTFHSNRMKIVYEDNDIIVVEKGYGLLSMGTEKKKEGTAYSLLRDYLKRVNPQNKLFIVHRLDQHTSGLMMFAKSLEVKETMQHNWNNMVLERKYVAVVHGKLSPEEGEIKSYLTENKAHEVYSTTDPEKGQLAVTRYKTLKTRGKYSLVELKLATGRKNQIRVHMKESGHVIVGDRKYGAVASPIHRLALHAMTLRFVHPVTRKDMNFTSALPSGFSKLV